MKRLLRRWVGGKRGAGSGSKHGFCRYAFDTFYLLPDGYMTCCHWWPTPDLSTSGLLPPEQAWNHVHFRRLRASVLDGSYTYCRGCPRYVEGLQDERSEDCRAEMGRGPRRLVLCNEMGCNLRCWSCRESRLKRSPGAERRERAMLDFLERYEESISWVSLLSSGEVLTSPMHLRWLRSLSEGRQPGLTINLVTNGTLLHRSWPTLACAHYAIRELSISIDAATPETYALVREGGRWDELLKGLDLAAALRKEGDLKHLQLNFCVQDRNYLEIPAFVELGRRLGADRVFFNMLRPWWHPQEAFVEHSLADPAHPLHADFRARVAGWAFLRDDPLVFAEQLVGGSSDLVRKRYHDMT